MSKVVNVQLIKVSHSHTLITNDLTFLFLSCPHLCSLLCALPLQLACDLCKDIVGPAPVCSDQSLVGFQQHDGLSAALISTH